RVTLSSDAQRCDRCAGRRRLAAAVACPCRHQPATLFEHFAAPIDALGLALNRMCKALLADFACVVGPVGGPIGKGRAKAVRRRVYTERFQGILEGIAPDLLARAAAIDRREDKLGIPGHCANDLGPPSATAAPHAPCLLSSARQVSTTYRRQSPTSAPRALRPTERR